MMFLVECVHQRQVEDRHISSKNSLVLRASIRHGGQSLHPKESCDASQSIYRHEVHLETKLWRINWIESNCPFISNATPPNFDRTVLMWKIFHKPSFESVQKFHFVEAFSHKSMTEAPADIVLLPCWVRHNIGESQELCSSWTECSHDSDLPRPTQQSPGCVCVLSSRIMLMM